MRITREREDCSVTRNRREGTEMWTTIVRRTQLSRSCFSALKQDVRSGNWGLRRNGTENRVKRRTVAKMDGQFADSQIDMAFVILGSMV
jgi:hypothetical protein